MGDYSKQFGKDDTRKLLLYVAVMKNQFQEIPPNAQSWKSFFSGRWQMKIICYHDASLIESIAWSVPGVGFGGVTIIPNQIFFAYRLELFAKSYFWSKNKGKNRGTKTEEKDSPKNFRKIFSGLLTIKTLLLQCLTRMWNQLKSKWSKCWWNMKLRIVIWQSGKARVASAREKLSCE